MSYPAKHRDSFTYSNQRNSERGYEAFNQYSRNRYGDVSDVAENRRKDKNQYIDGLSQKFNNKIFPSESDSGGYRSVYLDGTKNLNDPDSRFRDRTSTSHKISVYFDDDFQRRNEMKDIEADYRASYLRSFDESRNDPDFERFSGANKNSFSEIDSDAKLSYHYQYNNKNRDELNPQLPRLESPYREKGTGPDRFPLKDYSYPERRSTSPQFQHDTRNIYNSERLSQGYHSSANIRRTDCQQFSEGNYRYSERQGPSQEKCSRDNDLYPRRTRGLESMQHEQLGGVSDLTSEQSSRGTYLYSRRQERKSIHEQVSREYDLYSKRQTIAPEKFFRGDDLPYERNSEDVEYSNPLKFKDRNERTQQFSQRSDSPSQKRNRNLEQFCPGDSYSDRDFRPCNDFSDERKMRDSERLCHKQFDDTSERRTRGDESYHRQFYDKSERTSEEFSRDNFEQSNPNFAQWSRRGDTFSERQGTGNGKPSDLSPKRTKDLELFYGRELESKSRIISKQSPQLYNSCSERTKPDSLRNNSYSEKITDNSEYFYEQRPEDRIKITLKPFSQNSVPAKGGFDSDFHDKHGGKETNSLQQFSPKNQSYVSFVEQQECKTETKDFPIMLEEVKSTTGPYGFLVVHYLCKEHPLDTLIKTATDFNLKLQEKYYCNETTGMWETDISLNGIHLSRAENVYREESKTRAAEIGVEKLRNLYFTVLFFALNPKGIVIDDEGYKWKSAINKLLGKKIKTPADVRNWKSLLPVMNMNIKEAYSKNVGNFSHVLEPIKTLEKAENVIKEYYNSEDVNDYSVCHNLSVKQRKLLQEYADTLGIEHTIYSTRIKGKFIKYLRISKNLEILDLVNRLIKNNYSLGFGPKYKLLRPGQDWGVSPYQIVYQYDKRKNMNENKY